MYQPNTKEITELITLSAKRNPLLPATYRVIDRYGKLVIESTEDTETEARTMAIAIYENNPDAVRVYVNNSVIVERIV